MNPLWMIPYPFLIAYIGWLHYIHRKEVEGLLDHMLDLETKLQSRKDYSK